eukprot:CAMPEP_0176326670 /NCGR_PEP_ID=MMETSP0121_2-20121125/74045_1 /TAXON_ID=160619 /ORGANISM="Kryptoperidinium foliaceum, Strain CCMP 1326" /LENGTH=41 /DNA_ID= /DNA_START= /DNA_END= /DNA_ORIENTATION=
MKIGLNRNCSNAPKSAACVAHTLQPPPALNKMHRYKSYSAG